MPLQRATWPAASKAGVIALTKSLEIHPIRRNIQHADLLVVRRGEKVTVEVTVVVEGDAAPGTLVTQVTNAQGQTIAINATGTTVVHGLYGDLTISANGTYTYTLTTTSASANGRTENFTYTIAHNAQPPAPSW